MLPRVCVFGLWHLGSVTAACLAQKGFQVVGLDPCAESVRQLQRGKAPLFEPGLDNLLEKGLQSGRLAFSNNIGETISQSEIIWVCFDTPVHEDDSADSEFVLSQAARTFTCVQDGAVVLLSSQVPIGSTRSLAKSFEETCPGKTCHFAYSPENLRLGSAIDSFMNPGRVVAGVDCAVAKSMLSPLLDACCSSIIWMTPESAEMVKHALNAFLATSIVFANEIATLCEAYGGDYRDVEKALKSDARIGPRAYVRAGNAFGGGTLARDVRFLSSLADKKGISTPTLASILSSNSSHRSWSFRHIKRLLQSVADPKVCILGLSYKPHTDSIRRSWALELCQWLHEQRIRISAFDPQVRSLPLPFAEYVQVCDTCHQAAAGSDALVIATEWPEFNELVDASVMNVMRNRIVLDCGGFLADSIAPMPNVNYLSVGRPHET